MAVVFLEGGLSPIPIRMASTKLHRGPRRRYVNLCIVELFMQPLDGVGCACALPLARRPGKGEQMLSCFLQAVGDGAMLEPPFAHECLAPRLHLPTSGCVDH